MKADDAYHQLTKELRKGTVMDYQIKLSEWNSTITDTLVLLNSNTEWKQRYSTYAKEISSNLIKIHTVRKNFHEWAPLKFYLNVTNAKNAKKTVHFDIRYLGQSIAELVYFDGLKLNLTKHAATNMRDFGYIIKLRSSIHFHVNLYNILTIYT